jgi:hypothetical protein
MKRISLRRAALLAGFLLATTASSGRAQDDSNAATNAPVEPRSIAQKIRAVDADDHWVVLNRSGLITLIVGTSEDSQDAARQAGKAMYPFQGRPDFQLIVVVDLRDSIANWVPSVVTAQMRTSLDQEAIELKPYFLKNGNTSDPRKSSHVIPDFNGSVFPQLGWPDGSDDLRCILYGVDGRELKRWDKVSDMDHLQADVKAALDANAERVKATTKISAPVQ